MRHLSVGLASAAIVTVLLTACGGGGGGGSGSSSSGGAANTAPTANAGPAQSVNTGTTVTLDGSASSDADGSVVSYAWTQTAGTAVTLTSASNSRPTFSAPVVPEISILTFSLVVTDNRGSRSSASTVNITVNPVIAGTANITGKVRFARVPFLTTGRQALDYAKPVLQPARGVQVRALHAGTVVEISGASAVTSATGDYSLPVPTNIDVVIEVVARMQKIGGSLPNWDVRVQDGVAGATPYKYQTASIGTASGITQNIDIPTGISASGTATTSPRPSAPFAILDTIYTAQQAVIGVSPSIFMPELIVDWGSQSDGTFFTVTDKQYIALLSDLTEDTDEFDQHVIAHEFGHYIEHNFSRADNIGGGHGLGDRLDPRVAFGEGFGYAFAAIVLNDSKARDSFFGDVDNDDVPEHASGGFDVELNPTTSPPGAANDREGCWCSESSVWSILYDLYDSAADSNDTVALGLQPIWDVLVGAQKDTPAFTTLFTFISALKAARPSDATAIDTLVAAQNIVANDIDAFATNETHYPDQGSPTVPQDAALPLYTTMTLGSAPVTLQNVNDAGRYNKLGNHRFVRFNVPAMQDVTITLASSNPDPDNDPDFVLWRGADWVGAGDDPPSGGAEEEFFEDLPAGDYLLDVYDCANGCFTEQGISGDYVLTVTIN